MRAIGYQAVDLLVDAADRPARSRRCGARRPRRWRRGCPGRRRRRRRRSTTCSRGLRRDVLPYMNRADHPRLLRLHPVVPDVPGRGRRLHRVSALNVYAGSWMEAAGPSQVELTVLDWFKDWLGYPAAASGLLLSGGQRGQHDRARVRARDAARADERPRGRLRVRPGALVAGARGPAARLPARPAAGAARRTPTCGCTPRTLAEAIDADVAAGRRAAVRSVCGGRDQHRRDRPARRARRRLPRARRVAARRRRLRRVRGADRARAGGAARDRARRLDRARPAQVALPADRVRRAARARGRAAAARVRDRPGLPEGRRGRRGRGQLLRPRAAAHARLAGAEGLAVDPDARAGRLPRRDRPLARPRRARRATHPRDAGARAAVARAARASSASGARRRTRRRNAALVAPSWRRPARRSCPRRGCTASTRSGSACSTTRRARRTSSGCSTGSPARRCRRPARPRRESRGVDRPTCTRSGPFPPAGDPRPAAVRASSPTTQAERLSGHARELAGRRPARRSSGAISSSATST